MRAVVQRVACASVEVEGRVAAKSDGGLLIFLGVGRDDMTSDAGASAARVGSGATDGPVATPGTEHAAVLAEKVANLRIFPDMDGKSNLSVRDTGGSALVVSQFTLYADCRRGRRPSFTDAADPVPAEALVEEFCRALEALGIPTARGKFGAHMTVSLVNDGPYTILLDTEALCRPRRARRAAPRRH